MAQVIYLNGGFVSKEDAKISVYDHGFLYGDGIFEGIRVYNGNIFKCKEHLDRLYDSAKSIMLEIPLTFGEMQDVLVETIRRNELRDVHSAGRLPRTRGSRPRPAPFPEGECHYHRGTAGDLPGRSLRQRAEDGVRLDAPQRARRAQSEDQITELPEQYFGENSSEPCRRG